MEPSGTGELGGSLLPRPALGVRTLVAVLLVREVENGFRRGAGNEVGIIHGDVRLPLAKGMKVGERLDDGGIGALSHPYGTVRHIHAHKRVSPSELIGHDAADFFLTCELGIGGVIV